MDTIYIEEAVMDHPRARKILDRYPRAAVVPCRTYGEVFNPRAQDFRLQKRNPALIIAEKQGAKVLPTPPSYGIGPERSFYFSHLLNCLYDCRYCFLQGMFRSANYVCFVNYEGFVEAIRKEAAAAQAQGETACFFSGYDCDSLALESVTGFAAEFLDHFEALPGAMLELRTKSVSIHCLTEREPMDNVVVAFTLSPAEVAVALEHRAPSLDRRLAAMRTLAEAGWRIGLRIDPLIDYANFESGYRELIERIFSEVPETAVHSATFGPLRFPREMLTRITRLYPEEALFAVPFELRADGLASYPESREEDMRALVGGLLIDRLGEARVFDCVDSTDDAPKANRPPAKAPAVE